MTITDLTARRLDLAGTRSVRAPGRRAGHAGERSPTSASTGSRTSGAGLRAAPARGRGPRGGRQLARGDGGPLSDYDLVLLHHGAALAAAEVDRRWPTGSGTRSGTPGVRLDHSVRTVSQCRTVASDDLSAAVGLLDLDYVAGDAGGRRRAPGRPWPTTGAANARKRLPQLHESIARAARPRRATSPTSSSPTSRRPTAACGT